MTAEYLNRVHVETMGRVTELLGQQPFTWTDGAGQMHSDDKVTWSAIWHRDGAAWGYRLAWLAPNDVGYPDSFSLVTRPAVWQYDGQPDITENGDLVRPAEYDMLSPAGARDYEIKTWGPEKSTNLRLMTAHLAWLEATVNHWFTEVPALSALVGDVALLEEAKRVLQAEGWTPPDATS